jgi:hypothetical protein
LNGSYSLFLVRHNSLLHCLLAYKLKSRVHCSARKMTKNPRTSQRP